jgi:hypothetical protein
LLVIAAVCVGFYAFGSQNIPYLEHLATVGGIAYAVSNLANLAK